MPRYFSDREHGPRPRTVEEIGSDVWEGLFALIQSRVNDGSFGFRFPLTCHDGSAPYGCNETNFWSVARAHVPDLLRAEDREHGLTVPRQDDPPPTLAVLDFLEFCFDNLAQPHQQEYHPFFQHWHLTFDQDAGRDQYRQEINEVFARNGLVFDLTEEGRIERLAPVGLREALSQAIFSTGDAILDDLLETARGRYLSPDEAERRVALEKLWDAFERIKTLEHPEKRTGASLILDKAAPSSPKLRQALERDAREELTKLGNELMIRHHETDKEPIAASEHIDYLFGRMFSLVRLLLKMSGRGG